LCTYNKSHVKVTEECEYSSEFYYNGATHYHICGCGHKIDVETHYDNNDDELCDVCEMKMIYFDGSGSGLEGTECDHTDSDSNGLCDECGEEFTDGEETPDTPEDSEECQHRDANDDGKCDKCDSNFSDGSEYSAYPGGSPSGPAPAFRFEETTDEMGSISELITLSVYNIDLDVLSNVEAFYAEDFEIHKKNEGTYSITPIKITTHSSSSRLYKVRITLRDNLKDFLDILISENCSHYIVDSKNCCIEFYYVIESNVTSDTISGKGMQFLRNDIVSIEVFVYDSHNNSHIPELTENNFVDNAVSDDKEM